MRWARRDLVGTRPARPLRHWRRARSRPATAHALTNRQRPAPRTSRLRLRTQRSGPLTGGRLVDELLGEVAQSHVFVVGTLPQHHERFVSRNLMPCHQDAFGLPDDVTRADRLAQAFAV